jgi:hypothetical protein
MIEVTSRDFVYTAQETYLSANYALIGVAPFLKLFDPRSVGFHLRF